MKTAEVGPFADQGGRDGAHPQETALGPELQLGQDERIEKFTDQVGDEGSDQQARGEAQDGVVGVLGIGRGLEDSRRPEEAGREHAGDPDGGDGQQVAEEAGPDHPAGLGVSRTPRSGRRQRCRRPGKSTTAAGSISPKIWTSLTAMMLETISTVTKTAVTSESQR